MIPEVFSGRLEWVGVQLFGALTIGAFAFVKAYAFIRSTNSFVRYRVSPEDEPISCMNPWLKFV